MTTLDPRDPASFRQIEALIERIGPHWRALANIVDVVPALKVTKGVVQVDRLSLGFYVDEKVSLGQLADRGYAPIPKDIEGIPTDVIPARRRPLGSVDEKATRSQMFDTLVGGIAVGNANMNAYGTLGMIVFAQDDGRPLGLTNEHVLVFDTDGHVGDEVQQPRFYLNSEVSIDPADCCPNGQLHYRGVDNPIVDAAAAVFAAAALAAALSDTIDPHRRGQDATVPDPDERTLGEVVSVQLKYPHIPFPGRPYAIGVDWDYRRETDRRSLTHSVSETKHNEHVVQLQELLTDASTYRPADRVTFYALLSPERGNPSCHHYFVTAAALSPSHRRAYKLILQPWRGELTAALAGHATHGVTDANTVRRCIRFANEKPQSSFSTPRGIEGELFDPLGHTALFVRPAAGGPPALRFPDRGLRIRFHHTVQAVGARIERHSSAIVTLTAFSGSTQVAVASTSAGAADTLAVAGDEITHVVLAGGSSEALLRELCMTLRSEHFCVYRGELPLAPDEELGTWSTYLFAQTRNDVSLGTEPTLAAQTIGGLPVTDNFVDAGSIDHITYGRACLVDLRPNGSFDVVARDSQQIG